MFGKVQGLFLYVLFCVYGAPADESVFASQPVRVVMMDGDVHIRTPVVWRDTHYQIRGNLVLHEDGELVAERCTIELMNSYSREFQYQWRGGRMITREVIIGGTKQGGAVCQCNFELHHGEWICIDTTVRYSYGIGIGIGEKEHWGRLDATRLRQGPNPDSVIMNGRGEAIIRDSEFNIALNVKANRGGVGEFDLPVDEPFTASYDKSNTPGATYRLKLINTRVPLWFLFVGQIYDDKPPCEIRLRRAPRLIMSVLGGDLTGKAQLPTPWPVPGQGSNQTLNFGNVTLKALSQDIHVGSWGVYLWGSKTDLTLRGPTTICELMLWAGRASLIGEPGTFNAETSATTIDVGRHDGSGPPAELTIRNATVARPDRRTGVRGQITVHGQSRVTIENARCGDLLLITRQKGTIDVRNLEQTGKLEKRAEGGPIRFSDTPETAATDAE